MTLTLPVAVVKKEDGDTYLKILNEKPKYSYDIKKAEFNIKELFIGENDISKLNYYLGCEIIFLNFMLMMLT